MHGTGLDLLPCSHHKAPRSYLFSLVGYWSLTGGSPGPPWGLQLWSPSLILHHNLSLLPSQLESTSLHPGHVRGTA